MEALITFALNSFLKKFIKRASGELGSSLSVSLSQGSVILRNLELNLGPLLEKLPLGCNRAFAKELTISMTWPTMSSPSIQVIGSRSSICCSSLNPMPRTFR
jgi:hypothetical protein